MNKLHEIIIPVLNDIRAKKSVDVSELWGGAKALFLRALHQETKKPLIVVTASETDAATLVEDLRFFVGKNHFTTEGTVIMKSDPILSFKCALMIAASTLIFGCGREAIQLHVNARMEGGPAAQASVMVDGKNEGVTDANGSFSKVLKKKPAAEVEIIVDKQMSGYRIKPWKATVVINQPKPETIETYTFVAELEARRYITISATEKREPDPNGISAATGKADISRIFGAETIPVPQAVITISGKEMGKTDAKGQFVYEYKTMPKAGVEIIVFKPGYARWATTSSVAPGQKLEATLIPL